MVLNIIYHQGNANQSHNEISHIFSSGFYQKDREAPGNPGAKWWEFQLVQLPWKKVWQFLRRLKIELPYDLAISLQDIHSKELKAETQTDICTPYS